jgi:hypothetical protein
MEKVYQIRNEEAFKESPLFGRINTKLEEERQEAYQKRRDID